MRTFSTCICPISPEEFLSQYRGKSPVYFPGSPAKYVSLLGTHDLSQVLSRVVVSPGIVRIRRPEGTVPTDDFLTPVVPILGSHRQVIRAQAVEQQLRTGATLALEHCESYFEDVYAMCSMLAEVFLARVYSFLFLVYEPERPCGLHWDSYDMFICQIAGYKNWPVYKPLYQNPLLFDAQRSGNKAPVTELVQEFKLGPGDGLYIPRGWPHEPVAVEGPSMHVAFAIATPTGIDLLDWIRADLSKACAEIRADLPLSLSPCLKHAYASKVRQLVMERLSDEAVDKYYERHNVSVRPTPVELPPLATNQVVHGAIDSASKMLPHV